MDSELINAVLLGASAVGFGAGVYWQIKRRQDPKKRSGSIDRVRASNSPAESVEPEVQTAPDASRIIGTMRPVMLAVTPIADDPAASELFVQRAHSADEKFYREIPHSRSDLKEIACLFEHLSILDKKNGDDLSENVYTLSFSPIIDEVLRAGYHPRVNATAMDLNILAFAEDGSVIGEPMSMPDYSWGAPARIQTLWEMLNLGEHHPLEGEIRRELSFMKSKLAKLKLLIPAARGHAWQLDWEALFDLSRDLRRLGYEPGKAQERMTRADVIAENMRRHNRRIDKALVDLQTQMKSASDADVAVTSALSLLWERELSVLFLRAIALLRVLSNDDYAHGMRCSSHLKINLDEFPHIEKLLEKARHIVYESVEKEGRTMPQTERDEIAALAKDIDRMKEDYRTIRAELEDNVAKLQEKIDHFLIVQSRPKCFAVRMSTDKEVETLLVLDH